MISNGVNCSLLLLTPRLLFNCISLSTPLNPRVPLRELDS